ncbi:unnamed protein product, partial [Allacma fusca]
EVCIKSAGMFKGYYKNEEETQNVIDEDGWLHTGDIATWLSNGTIKIIDRKKNIFKLSQGEYVAPEKIEIVYVFSRLVTQIFITGDSLEVSGSLILFNLKKMTTICYPMLILM